MIFFQQKILKLIHTIIVIVSCFTAIAQTDSVSPSKNGKLIQLIQADFAQNHRSGNYQLLIGNVILKHEEAFLYCDSAYLNKTRNDLQAFGNVHIIDKDTINLYGKYILYQGNTKFAEIHENVILTDPTTVLKTNILYYDRKNSTAYYKTTGFITNKENNLKSLKGTYFLDNKNFHFFSDVEIKNPNYSLFSDTVYYNCNTELANSYGKTTITNDTNTILCKKAIYDYKNNKSFLNKDVEIYYNEYIVFADSTYYDEKNEHAEAFGNVVVIDTVNYVKTWSQYLEYDKFNEYAFISDSATLRYIDNNDTTFVSADTLFVKFYNETNKIDVLKAYHLAKIFNKDYQALCDSIVYFNNDSTSVLFRNPALWTDKNQITGDSLVVKFKNKEVNEINATHSGFIISVDSLGAYNQIKGNTINLFLSNNKINFIDVIKNSQIIYFLRDDDNEMVGPYLIISGNSKIFFENNDIIRLLNSEAPKSELIPIERSEKDKETLNGFNPRFNEIPVKPEKEKFIE